MGQKLSKQAEIADHNWDMDQLARTVSAAGKAIYRWDIGPDRLEWSPGAREVLGQSESDVPNLSAELQKRIAPDDLPARAIALAALLNQGEDYCCEFKLRRSDGGFEWVEERGAVELDGAGKAVRFQGLLRVITSWKKREFELECMAFFDDLTGHLNRTRLQEALDEVLETCREDGTTAAYLMVNIDRLGLLNDAYSFNIADAVIMDIGKRVEDYTSVGDIIGRAGGNQFGLILPGAGDVELRKVTDQILTATRRREVTTEAGPLAISLSLGGVLLPKDAANSREVMGETQLYECLLRMLIENCELVPAGLFIPVVEKLGLIRRLDIFTLEMTLLKMEQVADINLAVNISGMTATDPSSLDHLLSLVHVHSGVADRLIFEITETVAMMDFEETAHFANKMRDLGCRIALADFGAGYTSYRHLKALAVDIVKIDGQFVKDLHINRENQLFVQTLLDLAHGFNAQVVGECVETEDEAQTLRQRGVKYLQGYHFAAPPWSVPGTTETCA